jgi:hypothetical protein
VVFVTKEAGPVFSRWHRGSAALQTANSISWYSFRNRVGWIPRRSVPCSAAAEAARTLVRLPVSSRSATILRLNLI